MQQLPMSEKMKMLPVVLLAPWLNSISFDNTINIISDSVGDNFVIVDLDRFFSSESSLPSREYFRELMDPSSGPEKWIDLVVQNEKFIPTIQTYRRSQTSIDQQISIFRELGRGFVFRFEIDRDHAWDDVFSNVERTKSDDILVVFDYGYGDPTNITENKVSRLIDRLITISPEIKFVVTGSSFPNSFSEFDDFSSSKTIGTRILFENLIKKYGNYSLYYGDWASTKPRRYDGGGNRPLPRIDYPTKSRWIIARSKEEDWDFEEAAKRITRIAEWSERPLVWGTGMIEKTAKGLPGGISTGPEAIASRVNIHLYVQNNYTQPVGAPPPQGKWIDPI